MHLTQGLVPLCNHLYVTKGAILYGAVSDVSALRLYVQGDVGPSKKGIIFSRYWSKSLIRTLRQVDRRSNKEHKSHKQLTLF